MPKIIYNGKEYPDCVPYKDFTGTLVAGQTSITFENDWINPSRTVDFHSDVYGVNPTDVLMETGSLTLIYAEQVNDIMVKVRIS